MGDVIRADAALLAEVQAGDGATLHTVSGAVVSWAALHLLAAHGFRWAPEDPSTVEPGPTGLRLHVDLTIEHAGHAGLVLAATPARFIERSFGTELAFSLAEGSSALAPARLTAMAERRSPRDATFVVTGTGSRAVGGVLTVQRGPRSVFETLRRMVALPEPTDDLRVVRDGLEAGLQSVMLGCHPQSAQFSTSRGRVDGVVDTAMAGPPAPLGVFSGARETRARGLRPIPMSTLWTISSNGSFVKTRARRGLGVPSIGCSMWRSGRTKRRTRSPVFSARDSIRTHSPGRAACRESMQPVGMSHRDISSTRKLENILRPRRYEIRRSPTTPCSLGVWSR
jgi:hypothetical protein